MYLCVRIYNWYLLTKVRQIESQEIVIMKLNAHHTANGLFSYFGAGPFRPHFQPHPARKLCPEDDQSSDQTQTSAPTSFPNWNLGLWALHPVELPCRMAAGFGEMGFEWGLERKDGEMDKETRRRT